jgi:ribonucleoside-diphosphate reductase alpha chain
VIEVDILSRKIHRRSLHVVETSDRTSRGCQLRVSKSEIYIAGNRVGAKVMTSIVEEPRDSPNVGEHDKRELKIPSETLAAFGGDELRARVFYEKYALRDEQGRQVEKVPDDMWRRVAKELASPERDEEKRQEWTAKFHWLLQDYKFVPGGRILFGAGQTRRSTLLNCYFFRIREDSIEAIFDWCKEAARTYSFGGGVGTDISVLRPRGAPVNNSAIYSSGSVSFMELLSTTTGTIGQAGRRGALIITMRVDHPDVMDFINVKKDLKKVNYANISVKITDHFMRAVESDGDFLLHFKNEKAEINRTVMARDVWKSLIRGAWESAEPGVLFWDTIKRESTTEYGGMEVQGVNPCSEQTLENYGCCCLGSVNLSAFVQEPFTERASIDWESLTKATQFAVRFLDNVLDYNTERHPLYQQKDASLRSRRIGVGITGLGDMLIKLGLKYDEDSTIGFVDHLFERIKNLIYDYSTDLAKEKGSFPAFNAERHLDQPFTSRLDEKVKEKIRAQGIRNAAITTIPPVGSGSILAGCSSGIEPVFALHYTRRTKSLSESEFKVFHPLVREYMVRTGAKNEGQLPSYFVTSHQIKPEMRVKMQATIQKHIDTAISSTVNLSQETTPEKVEEIYLLAWKMGCKGITVYREGSREGILETAKMVKKAEQPKAPFDRPRMMEGRTLKLNLPQGGLYLTANLVNGELKEVFVTLGKSGGDEKADAEALGRLISLYLQHGGDAESAISTLKGIKGKYVSWDEGTQLLSIPDAIAKALELLTLNHVVKESEVPLQPAAPRQVAQGGTCPDCNESSLIFENGCYKCTSCGYSKCE